MIEFSVLICFRNDNDAKHERIEEFRVVSRTRKLASINTDHCYLIDKIGAGGDDLQLRIIIKKKIQKEKKLIFSGYTEIESVLFMFSICIRRYVLHMD